MIYYSLLFSLLALYSRGFFEIFFSKSFAYLLEFSLFFLFVVLFFRTVRVKILIKFQDILVVLSLVAISVLSLFLSFIKNQDFYYLAYIAYFFYIAFLYLIVNGLEYSFLNYKKLVITLNIVVIILFSVACLEQLRIFYMPGESSYFSSIRPASLTGSYLHYPLVLVSVGFFLFSLEKKVTISVMLAFLGVFLAFSRSGMLIVILTFVFLLLKFLFSFRGLKISKSLIRRLILIGCFLFVLSFFLSNIIDIGVIISRIASIASFKEPGNLGRIEAWKLASILWLKTNLFIGEYFGKVTNFTRNIVGDNSFIVESSLLELLLNVGLLGTLIYYVLWFRIINSTRNIYFKAFLLSAMIETLVYQSIEVFPFITSLFLFYSFVRGLKKDVKNERKFFYNGNYLNL